MTNEFNSNEPANSPDSKPITQSPVAAAPPTPPQNKIADDPNDDTKGDKNTAKELAREFRWMEGAQLIISGVLAVVGIVALCIYHGQLTAMQGQLAEMQGSGKQTDKLICLYQQQIGKMSDQVDQLSRQADDTHEICLLRPNGRPILLREWSLISRANLNSSRDHCLRFILELSIQILA